MRRAVVVAAAVLVAAVLSGCQDKTEPGPSGSDTDLCEVYGFCDNEPPPRSGSAGSSAGDYDPDTCEMLYAQRSVNDRLNRDGYADDYGQDWDDLIDAAGCPPPSQLPDDNGSGYDAELCASLREMRSLDRQVSGGSYSSEYDELMDAADCP